MVTPLPSRRFITYLALLLLEPHPQLAEYLVVSDGDGDGGQEVLNEHRHRRVHQSPALGEVLLARLQLVQPSAIDNGRQWIIPSIMQVSLPFMHSVGRDSRHSGRPSLESHSRFTLDTLEHTRHFISYIWMLGRTLSSANFCPTTRLGMIALSMQFNLASS